MRALVRSDLYRSCQPMLRGDAAVQAAEQDDRHQERGKGLARDARQLAQRHLGLDREVALAGEPGDERHLCHAEQEARDHPAEEQVADRRVGHERVEHERDRRRDDGTDHRRRCRERRREARRVLAVARHERLHDLAAARGIGERGARHAREHDALHHVHLREPAAIAAHERIAELEQPIHDAAAVHELGGEDEQRHGEEHVARVHAVEQLLGRGPHVEAGDPEVEHRARDHRVPDRQPEQAQRDDGEDGERERTREVHRPEPVLAGSATSTSSPRKRCHSSHR